MGCQYEEGVRCEAAGPLTVLARPLKLPGQGPAVLEGLSRGSRGQWQVKWGLRSRGAQGGGWSIECRLWGGPGRDPLGSLSLGLAKGAWGSWLCCRLPQH